MQQTTVKLEGELETELNPAPQPSALHAFAKTSTAAKLSGTALETTGLFKRLFGEFTQNAELENAGRNQQLLGKVHHLVGDIREVRELGRQRLRNARAEGAKLLHKHGVKFLDQASELLDDLKDILSPK